MKVKTYEPSYFRSEKLLKMESDDVKPFIEIRIKINNYYASLHHAYSSNY